MTLWYLIFCWSKVLELGDTIFVILRKQKLHKFHCIHHSLTLCYCWYVFGDVPATARWMVTMNFACHSLLYCYYTLKSLSFKISKSIAMLITLFEIIQMLIGFYINLMAYSFKLNGSPCDISMSVAQTGFILYSLFFILFCNYFIRSFVINHNHINHGIQFIKDQFIILFKLIGLMTKNLFTKKLLLYLFKAITIKPPV